MKVFVNDLSSDEITVVDYNGEATTYSVKQELAVDEHDYQQEFLSQPAKYAFWTAVLQKARLVLAGQQAQLDKLHARLYQQVVHKLDQEGVRATKDLVESRILQDDAYQQQLATVNNCEYSAGQVQYLVKAFEQRKDMLVQFGASQRQEQSYGN